MAKIQIHAGDWGETVGYLGTSFMGNHRVDIRRGFLRGRDRYVFKRDIAKVEPASEENVKRLGGTLGWGAAGGLLLGPVGLLAGLLAGGRHKEVTFICVFKDGKRIFATADNKTYVRLLAAVHSPPR